MRQITRHTALGLVALAAGIAVVDGDATWRAARSQEITEIDGRVVAINGASAISQVGTFLNVPAHPLPPVTCGNPIPSTWAEATFGLMGRSPDHVAGCRQAYWPRSVSFCTVV